MAEAEAWLQRRYATEGETVMQAVRAYTKSLIRDKSQRFRSCPVCGSDAVATGEHDVVYTPAEWDEESGDVTNVVPEVWFSAHSFRCSVCHLHLDSAEEIDHTFDPVWEIVDADWRDYEPHYDHDPDAEYERWREERNPL
jgi:hypothetical protein